jgi:GAG-pre-integrase domain
MPKPVTLGNLVNKPCKCPGAINTPILTTTTKHGNLYILDVPNEEILLTIEENSNSWHQRIGYISNQVLNKLLQASEGVPHVTLSSNICNSCVKAKFTNKVNKGPTNKPKYYLKRVVADLNGPITPNTPKGEDISRYSYPLL